ncbi:MAG: hypothetical protein EBR09_10165 [Proteobacteria bacterium]|nr:hypothetical protein [Pseudomonadota bacterium]
MERRTSQLITCPDSLNPVTEPANAVWLCKQRQAIVIAKNLICSLVINQPFQTRFRRGNSF